jgi:hypothetical protein
LRIAKARLCGGFERLLSKGGFVVDGWTRDKGISNQNKCFRRRRGRRRKGRMRGREAKGVQNG